MTKYNILLTALVAFVLCGCGKKVTDLEQQLLLGKVRRVYEVQYIAVEKYGNAEKGEPFRDDGYDSETIYNENGYIDNISYVTPYGDTVGREKYFYDAQGYKSQIVEYDSENEISSKTAYIYDKKRRETQIIRTDKDGGIQGSVSINYIDSKNQIERNTYSPGGKTIKREVSVVDDDARPVEVLIYSEEKKLVNWRKMTYNKNDLPKAITVLYPELYPATEQVYVTMKFSYDDKGNVVSQEGADERGEAFMPVTFKYVFDDKGNWTERVQYVGETPQFVVERVIEYYE